MNGGPSSTQSVGHICMSGREVFRHAAANLYQPWQVLDATGLGVSDVDWLVPHQAMLVFSRLQPAN